MAAMVTMVTIRATFVTKVRVVKSEMSTRLN